MKDFADKFIKNEFNRVFLATNYFSIVLTENQWREFMPNKKMKFDYVKDTVKILGEKNE